MSVLRGSGAASTIEGVAPNKRPKRSKQTGGQFKDGRFPERNRTNPSAARTLSNPESDLRRELRSPILRGMPHVETAPVASANPCRAKQPVPHIREPSVACGAWPLTIRSPKTCSLNQDRNRLDPLGTSIHRRRRSEESPNESIVARTSARPKRGLRQEPLSAISRRPLSGKS